MRVSLLTGLIGVLAITACEKELRTETPVLPESPAPLVHGAAQASMHVGPLEAGQQTAWIRLTGVEGLIGSYQLRAAFDPATIQLVQAAMTDGDGADLFGVLNRDQAASGVLRLAGFSTAGFDARDVASLTFRTSRPLRAGDVELAFEVVGTVDGAEIAEDRLAVVSDLQPLQELKVAR